MQPGHWYFLALALIVLPSLPFSIGAMLVGGVWMVGQLLYLASGIDSPGIDGTLNGFAVSVIVAVVILRWRWSMAFLALTFVLMIYINYLQIIDDIHPYYAWWYNYWLAMLQVAIVPFTVKWSLVKEGVAALRDDSFFDNLLRVAMPWKA